MRLFIGLNIPEEIRRHVLEKLGALQSAPGVRWSSINSIHITLKFIGDCGADKTSLLTAVLSSVASRFSPLSLRLRSGGSFPQGSRPRVLWTAVEGDVESLTRMASQIEEELISVGFPKENRSFHPHLTLGRVGETPAPVDQFCTLFRDYESPLFTIDKIELIQSFLRSSGARYETLESFPMRSSCGVSTL